MELAEKDRDPQNRIESSEIGAQNLRSPGLMAKEARVHSREETVSSISDAVKTGQLHVKEHNRVFSNTIH